jgi:hypothetical protein
MRDRCLMNERVSLNSLSVRKKIWMIFRNEYP